MSDPRTTFANSRVAHASLRGHVDVRHFDEGTVYRVGVPVAPIYRSVEGETLDRQSLYGHPVRVIEVRDGWAFGREEETGHVGYLPHDDLVPWATPTHVVHARKTLLFSAPNIKAPNPVGLSLGAALTIVAQEGRFAVTDTGHYAVAAHLSHRDQPEADPVSVAERLLGAPYLWGGNSSDGIDCSGLVSAGLRACGLTCPADSDQQAEALGADVTGGGFKRGDLLFWKGHVALLADSDRLIHANAYHMAVAYESLTEAIKRIEAQGDGLPTRHKRL